MTTQPRDETFLQQCVTVPVYAAMHDRLPEWGYNQIRHGLPAISDRRPVLIHLPSANKYYESRLRSKGRKLAKVA